MRVRLGPGEFGRFRDELRRLGYRVGAVSPAAIVAPGYREVGQVVNEEEVMFLVTEDGRLLDILGSIRRHSPDE